MCLRTRDHRVSIGNRYIENIESHIERVIGRDHGPTIPKIEPLGMQEGSSKSLLQPYISSGSKVGTVGL